MTTKAELRGHFRRARASIAPEQHVRAAQQITAQLAALLPPTAPTMIYVGIRHELPTLSIIEALLGRGQPLAVPRVEGNLLVAARLNNTKDLTEGAFGVPTSIETPLASPQICITPGVAFTPAGDRLGQGGGFYDRFFAERPEIWRVGIAYDEQVTASLPTETHDQRVHTLITPTRLYGLSKAP